MYNVVFESENGEKYAFGSAGNTVFDMDFGNGMPVDIGTSQGFSQIGETVESQSVSGRTINVKGVVFGDVQDRKKRMRKVFSPFSSGRIIFDGKYCTKVWVKNAPSFSSVKDNGKFSMQLFAPFPFFYSVEETVVVFGEIRPLFKFPVNYSEIHRFGEIKGEKIKSVFNNGDVSIPLKLRIISNAHNTNVTISNMETFEFLRLNGSLKAGDEMNIYRDENNIFRVELTSNGETTDAIGMVSEESTLFEIKTGENIIGVNSDEGGDDLFVSVMFNSAVVALYED